MKQIATLPLSNLGWPSATPLKLAEFGAPAIDQSTLACEPIFCVTIQHRGCDTWKRCSDMPVAPGTCGNDASGVVVHEGRLFVVIKVITVDQCLTYADDTDGWTIKQYDKRIGDRVNAFVRRSMMRMLLNC